MFLLEIIFSILTTLLFTLSFIVELRSSFCTQKNFSKHGYLLNLFDQNRHFIILLPSFSLSFFLEGDREREPPHVGGAKGKRDFLFIDLTEQESTSRVIGRGRGRNRLPSEQGI